jgi:hypothetical protein
MKKLIHLLSFFLLSFNIHAQTHLTRFELSKGTETATYTECIAFYQRLANEHKQLQVRTFGATDAGYPLHLVLFSQDKTFDPLLWHQRNKVVILVNNGIHPGEPDGIDASMMFIRDLAEGKIKSSPNVVFGIIPVYNIGGSLNRNSFSRVNQNGPKSYGFRGNAQNLDLNRDFTKNDSKNAKAFAEIFHFLDPDILVDNHVSDGADYQHVMTLLTTQYNKLGDAVGSFLHDTFDPALYKSMAQKNFPMTPYVNFESANPDSGWAAFYDPPRYSSGYAALFQTIAFVPETHMLKPYQQRVTSTYELMRTIMEQAGLYAKELIEKRKASVKAMQQQPGFALSWKVDSTRYDKISFMGYEAAYKTSEVTGMQRLYYDHSRPYTKEIKYLDYFIADKMVNKPKAYIIPQGWWAVVDLLKLNGVKMQRLLKDTMINVEVYRIEDYKTSQRAYEKHYRHYDVRVSSKPQAIQFLKGDYIIYTGQRADRFVVEMLEPAGDDSYFSWNFFDAVLQQKEGYSDYRWEDVAAEYLKQHPELKQQLEEKKRSDPKFAASAAAQLEFVYKNSPWYEPAHLRYPVYRLN